MQYDPIRGQSQGHEPLKVGNPSIFKSYFFRHFQWQLATDHGFLNQGTMFEFDRNLISVLLFCVTWFWTWQKRRLWRVDRQSRTGLIFKSIVRVKWSHSNLWSQYDLHVVAHGTMSYFARLTSKDLSHYLNIIESVGLKNLIMLAQIGDLTVSAAKCLHFLALCHGGQNSWNEEITSHCQPIYSCVQSPLWLILVFFTVAALQSGFWITVCSRCSLKVEAV